MQKKEDTVRVAQPSSPSAISLAEKHRNPYPPIESASLLRKSKSDKHTYFGRKGRFTSNLHGRMFTDTSLNAATRRKNLEETKYEREEKRREARRVADLEWEKRMLTEIKRKKRALVRKERKRRQRLEREVTRQKKLQDERNRFRLNLLYERRAKFAVGFSKEIVFSTLDRAYRFFEQARYEKLVEKILSKKRKEDELRNTKSATKIQAIYKGRVQRRLFSKKLQEHRTIFAAAARFQSLWRGIKCRRILREQEENKLLQERQRRLEEEQRLRQLEIEKEKQKRTKKALSRKTYMSSRTPSLGNIISKRRDKNKSKTTVGTSFFDDETFMTNFYGDGQQKSAPKIEYDLFTTYDDDDFEEE
eukprot:g3204.t1